MDESAPLPIDPIPTIVPLASKGKDKGIGSLKEGIPSRQRERVFLAVPFEALVREIQKGYVFIVFVH